MSTGQHPTDPAQLLLGQVQRTRRRAMWLGCGRVALAVATVLAATPVVSTLILTWLPVVGRPLGAGVWLVAGAGCAVWLGRDQWRRARPRLGPAAAVEVLAAGDDRQLLVTGADLAAWGDGGAASRGVSAALAGAQVARAAARATALDPAAALPAEPLWRWAGGALLAGLLLVGWMAWNPGSARDAWTSLLVGGAPAPVRVGNLQLDLAPPAYTGLSATQVDGTDGAVQGYPGTRVTLKARLSRRVSSGQWEGPGGEVVALQLDGDRFTVSWLLQRAGTYRLAFFDGTRPVASDFLPRPQSLTEDQRPQVDMSAPTGDLEVTSDQEVELVFRVADDFRVERVEVVASGDSEVRLPVAVEPGRTAEGRARFLPLAHPELGEGAHLRLEAWDNDAVGGSKAGVGRSVYVAFLDKRHLLADIEGLQERLFEGLILHLGDHLEAGQGAVAGATIPDLQPLRVRAADLLVLLDRLAEQVQRGAEEGALAALTVLRIEQGLRGVLEPFVAGGGDRERIVAEVERDILFLDRLLRSLHMEQALSLGDEISSLQRDLFDSLQRGTSPEELVEQVARIQQLLAEMASQLGRGADSMPDSFANADAVQDMPASEMQELLQQLGEALRSGDRDAAKELAAQLLDSLSQWLAALEAAAGATAQGELDPLLQELAELEEQTSELMADQETLLGETREVGQRASTRAVEDLQQALAAFLERQEGRLQEVERQARVMEALTPHRTGQTSGHSRRPVVDELERLQLFEARRRLEAASSEVRSALYDDLGQARSAAEVLQQAFRELVGRVTDRVAGDLHRARAVEHARAAAERSLDDLLAELAALGRRRLAGLQSADLAQIQEQEQSQSELAGRAGDLAEKLAELARQTPLVGGAEAEGARGARSSMRGAGSSLGQGDPFAAVPQQGRALEQLAELSKRLQAARRQMLQGMQGQGMQIVRSPGQRPGGGQDVDRSRVDIPRETEAKELRAFREEVLRAMREGHYPEEYREEVERYYEGLIR